MRLTFTPLGGVGTVTGSKFLLETPDTRLLVDCGLFQGYKQLRKRNWGPLPVDPASIDCVILTHAHIDHSGYVPLLIKNGFEGQVHCTQATLDLCKILLRDSAYLAEKEAERANRYGYTKHDPAEPLYTQRDAQLALEQFATYGFDEAIDLANNVSLRFLKAGHILGAAIVELQIGDRTIVFSGDLGRPQDPVMPPPAKPKAADYLIVESTYGNRSHSGLDPQDMLADIVTRTAARGGNVIIPSFAVGRAQTILYHLHRLKEVGRIPEIPVFLDSPMAINATNLFYQYADDHKLSSKEARQTCETATYVQTAEDSKALYHLNGPKIIISASGMATGGRVLHHLKHYVGQARNTVLFAGFQAGGTRGASLVKGADKIKIHGEYHPVRAEVANLHMLSAHADADEIMDWLNHFERPPTETFIVHGEPDAADALRHRIEEDPHWRCTVPEQNEGIDLA